MIFHELVDRMPEWALTNREYASAIFLLGGLLPNRQVEAALIFHRADGLDDAVDLTIEWPRLLSEPTFSSGERVVVACAYSLFANQPNPDASLGLIVNALDETMLDRVLEAVKIARGIVPLLSSV